MRALYLVSILILIAQTHATGVFNTSVCTSSEFFDTTALTCSNCPSNMDQTGNGTTCACAGNNYNNEPQAVGFKKGCSACPSDTAPSSDNSFCIKCPSGVDTVTGDCQCATGQVPVDRNLDGSFMTTKQCVTCANGTLPGPSTLRYTSCSPCPYVGQNYSTTTTPWSCVCNTTAGYVTAADRCVTQTDLNTFVTGYSLTNANQLSYSNVLATDTSTASSYTITSSDTITYFYYKAGTGCLVYSDPQSCQTLANLCVLTLYNQKQTLCKLFQEAMQLVSTVRTGQADSGWVQGLPFLFYSETFSQVIYNPGLLLNVNFKTVLTYYLAKYDIYGNYYGLEMLTNQVLLCPNAVSTTSIIGNFGTTYSTSCEINLSSLMYSQTFFYEIFLQDADGSMVPIPVIVQNLQDSAGNIPNYLGNNDNWDMTQRFFMFDTISGITTEGGFISGQNTTVIQYAQSIRLYVSMNSSGTGVINLPYFVINYAQRTTEDILTNPFAQTSFKSIYYMNLDYYNHVESSLFITMNIVVLLVTLFRFYIWTKYNPMRFSPDNYFIWATGNLLLICMKTWGNFMFWFLLVITGYWWVFYKLQTTVFALVPDEVDNNFFFLPFRIVFGIMVLFQCIKVLFMIRRQSQVDVFLLDWEPPRYLIKKPEEGTESASVSVWRQLFVANELSELQTLRTVSMEFILFIFTFFMGGLFWDSLGDQIPALSLNNSNIPANTVLNYFIGNFILLVIGITAIILRRIVKIWFPLSIQEFCDLCALSNISVFMLDISLHGYYIHGAAPGGQSEGTAEDLRRMLELESKGTTKSRGLISHDPQNLQTFEIFIPWDMRQKYDGIFKFAIQKEAQEKMMMQQMSNQSRLPGLSNALPPGFNFKIIEKRKRDLQAYLKVYIEGVKANSSQQVLQKNVNFRLCGLPPIELEALHGNPIFFKDPAHSFEDTFFMGQDYELFIWNVSMFALWQLATGGTMVAIFLTFICDRVARWLRGHFGTKNLSEKTLIDEAFLV